MQGHQLLGDYMMGLPSKSHGREPHHLRVWQTHHSSKNPEPEPRNNRCRCHCTQIIPARPAQPRFDRPHSPAAVASKYALPTAACEVNSDVLPPLHPSSLHISSSQIFQTSIRSATSSYCTAANIILGLRRSPAKRKTILPIPRTQYHRIAHSGRSYCSLMVSQRYLLLWLG